MPQRVHRVEPIKPRPLLPRSQRDLDAAVGDAVARLVAEQWGADIESLASTPEADTEQLI